MGNPIVITNVSQTVAPTPSTLQSTGAFISQGALNTAPGTVSLLTQLPDLTPLLVGELNVTSITWSTNVATVTTAAPHGYTNADTLWITIAGASPIGYNGTFLCTVTGTSTFTYALGTGPSGSSSTGTYVTESGTEVVQMATTFFGQGANQAVYVLELGPGSPTDGVTYLTSWITAHPGFFYSYLVPRKWDAVAGYLAFLAGFENTNSKTYFFTTTTIGNYTNYTATMKCAVVMVEAPTLPATEFSLAAPFQVALAYAPSSTNKVTPYAYSFLYGVTPYPTFGNSALLNTLLAAHTSYVGTGAEGGISNTILVGGATKDGNQFNYWYSVDWVQINGDLDLSNAVINGSNNPINPLYYNQIGINRLQQVGASLMGSGITFGLVLNPVVLTKLSSQDLVTALNTNRYGPATIVNAVPFIQYNQDNPSDYSIGKYAGLSVSYTTQNGFINLVFNINVSQFANS